MTPEDTLQHGQQIMSEIRAETLQKLQEGKALDKAIRVLIQEIEAFEEKVFNDKGVIVYSKPMVSHMPRLKAIELLASMMGLKQAERVDIKHDLSTPFRQVVATLIQSETATKPDAENTVSSDEADKVGAK